MFSDIPPVGAGVDSAPQTPPRERSLSRRVTVSGARQSSLLRLLGLPHTPSARTTRSRNSHWPLIFTKRSSYSPARATVVVPSLVAEVINRKLVHRASLPLMSGRILVT